MARYQETLSATGFEPGGVCPFGLDGRIQILIDESLAQYQTIYPAAGTSASGVPMTFAQLASITGGQVGDFLAVEEAEGEKATWGERE
jgi:prolyl-tRNA editing enzyme YbaK/EbsC (Cys-tRNA(Pro) deacylase)